MQVVERNDYDSNVSDEEWAIIEPMLEQEKPTAGRPMEYAYRDIINGIFYLLKTGCQCSACRMTSHRTIQSIITIINGKGMAFGKGSTRHWLNNYAKQPEGTKIQRQ